MSTLYLASSMPTSAVFSLWPVGLGSVDQSAHVPCAEGEGIHLGFLLSVVSTAVVGSRQPRSAGQDEVRQVMFGTSFLVRSSCYGGEQCDPKTGLLSHSRGCQIPLLPRVPVMSIWPYGLSRLCAGLWLQLPVYPHLLLGHSPVATGLCTR